MGMSLSAKATPAELATTASGTLVSNVASSRAKQPGPSLQNWMLSNLVSTYALKRFADVKTIYMYEGQCAPVGRN